MLFEFEESNDYYQELTFYCPKEDKTFRVDISAAWDEQREDYNDAKVDAIVSKAFRQAFGNEASWTWEQPFSGLEELFETLEKGEVRK